MMLVDEKENLDIEQIKKDVLQRMEGGGEINDETIFECIDEVLKKISSERYISVNEKILIRKNIYNKISGLDILEELLEDDAITEIMVNGPFNIYIEKNGRIEKWNKQFESEEKLSDIVQRIVGTVNRRVNERKPIVDANIRGKYRVSIVLKPVAVNGPIITIRKFKRDVLNMENLIKLGSVNEELAEFFKMIVKSKYNIFISGATNCGKTTFLNILSGFIPKEERIITIEDSIELDLKETDNLVTLEARSGNVSADIEISIRDLIKTSLRMRPDRIIVGEVRGSECIDMLMAMNTGHDGSMSTGHGNSPQEMLLRLETMYLYGMDIPLLAVRNQLASSLDIMIHIGRLRDNSRKIMSVCEVMGVKNGEVVLNKLFEFVEEGEDENGKILGRFVKRSELIHREKLRRAGFG